MQYIDLKGKYMKKPMSLKDLPGYLDSLRKNNQSDDSLVVDMGMIVEKKPSWTKPIIFSSLACLLLVCIVVFSYSNEQVIIVVNSNASKEIVSAMIRENGGEVIEIESNTYKVKLNKFKNKYSFLEKLRSSKVVDSVELE